MPVLGVFAKWPEPGRVKTRLGLPPALAARVAEAFLRDTLHRLPPLQGTRRVVAVAPANAVERFAALLPPGWEAEPQADGDLGERLAAFFARHRAAGPVVVVGTDSPTLPPAFVGQAFALLADADVVLGPATDGGYYLVGLRGGLPPLFAGIDWSTPRVLEQTVTALPPPWRLALLPPWYDVDTPADWQLLCGHVAALRRAGEAIDLPHTEPLLDAAGAPL